MKFKEFLELIADTQGFIPTGHLRRIIHKNPRNTAREEAIAAKIIEQANPLQNISGRHPWGEEEQFVLQQLWIRPTDDHVEWRDVPLLAKPLFTVEETEHGPLPVPKAVREPSVVPMDLQARINEALGEEPPG